MWKRKYHMKIGGIDHLSPAFIHPDFLIYGLAVWAVTVTAGVVMELRMAAVRALGNVDAKGS